MSFATDSTEVKNLNEWFFLEMGSLMLSPRRKERQESKKDE
jgi:hypothetical protein